MISSRMSAYFSSISFSWLTRTSRKSFTVSFGVGGVSPRSIKSPCVGVSVPQKRSRVAASKILRCIVSLSLFPEDMNMSIASGEGLIFPIFSRDFHGRKFPLS